MKKIIGGKVYNTKTAQLLGEWTYSYENSFDYEHEKLYKTKKGAYFIYGYGHADSPYAKQNDNGTREPGEDIRLVSEEKAKEIAEQNLDPEDYAKIFDVEEG